MEFLPVFMILTGYLLGAIPFAYLVVKSITGEDVRDHHSGNAGATNAGRVLKEFMGQDKQQQARLLFKSIFLLDVLKAFVAVTLAEVVLTQQGLPPGNWPLYAGLAAVIGHMFPVFLKFRGGKGVACCLGILFGLIPLVALATFGVWLVVYLISGYVSLGSVVAAILLHANLFWILGPAFFKEQWVMEAFLIFLSVFVIFKHRSNLVRIANGTEPKARGQSS